jgi:wobble nucleotide-excising tRNase
MSKNYTTTDFIRQFYKETNASENDAIDTLKIIDDDFAQSCNDIQQVLEQLDSVDFLPNPTSISIIMEHSLRQHEAV